MSPSREILSESSAGFRPLVQCGQSVTEHSLQIQSSRLLIQRPKRFRILGIEFKELLNEPLRYLSG